MLNLHKKELYSLDRTPPTCRERFQRIIAGPFSRLSVVHKKDCDPSELWATDSRAPHSPRRRASFTCAAACHTMIEPKNMAAVRMSAPPKALICGLPIQFIGGA